MSTTQESPAQTRDALMELPAEISLPVYVALHDGREYGDVRFAFNPLADHPLSDDLLAKKWLFAQLWLACQKSRKPNERLCPWTLRLEETMGLIVVSDWASRYRGQFPDSYDDDSHFYARIREVLCGIVHKPPTEAPSFEPALELEGERDQEEQMLLREYRVDCSRGGVRRTIAALFESWGLKAPPPVPEIDPAWDYRRFLAHNGQMEELVRWFSSHTEEINRDCGKPPLT